MYVDNILWIYNACWNVLP